MPHGVKISESSKSVSKDSSSVQSNYSDETLSYMVSGIAIPYLRGAATSLQRFSDASKKEKTLSMSMSVFMKHHVFWKTWTR